MTPAQLRERTAAFAVDVTTFAKPLLEVLATRGAGLQLMRAATSVAANYRAAGRSRTRPEFISKVRTVLEEADESLYWLEHLDATGESANAARTKLKQEAQELVAIISRSVRTLRRRRGQGTADRQIVRLPDLDR